jgi:maltose alpha-D-glucosyltransferase / alpha-amylase
MRARRWFGGKARRIKTAAIVETIPLTYDDTAASIAMVRVDYNEGDAETYVLPLSFASGARAGQLLQDLPHAVIARVQIGGSGAEGVLYDPLVEPGFCMALLDLISGRDRLKGAAGELLAMTTQAFRHLRGAGDEPLELALMKGEQSNTSIIYGDRLIMKLFRRLEVGINPDLEVGRFLTEKSAFTHIPPVAGALEYRSWDGEPMSLAILQGFVPNQGDAWRYTLDALGRYFDRALTWQGAAEMKELQDVHLSTDMLLSLAEHDLPPTAQEVIGTYLESAWLLGQRTAEMHLALAGESHDPNFAPEPFTALYQRSIYQAMRSRANQSFQMLRKGQKDLPEPLRAAARQVLGRESQVLDRFRSVLDRKISAMRTRCHGDYHLGQVLYTGKDFFIIDFEGEPARPLSERRIKRSPLQDVAGMLRSFHYAPYAVLLGQLPGAVVRAEDFAILELWARLWYRWVSVAFWRSYLAAAGDASFLPRRREELQALLDAYLLEKAVYELGYELNNRPTWVRIPLEGILQLLAGEG